LKTRSLFVSKKFAFVILALALIFVFSACGKDNSTGTATPDKAASAKQMTSIRMGYLKSGGQTPQFVADREGFFEKHGLKVERIEFRDASKMVAGIESGDLDILASIPASILSAREQGFDLVTFMQNETAKMEAPDSGAILVGKDSGITSVKDLKGKKIALLSKGSQAAVDALYVLKKNGVDLNTLTLIAAPFATHADMLNSKQADASFTVDPFTTQIVESGVGKILSYNYIDTVPGQPLGAWWAKRDWVAKNPQIIEAFSLGIKDAIDYLHADEKRAQKIVADYTSLDLKVVVEKMPMINWNYNVDPDAWQKENAILLEMGALKKMPESKDYFADPITKYFIKK
jgi:ABC-type nitrate/sulfonate/bicarbonate transport system substrate-binding protein